MLLGKTRAELEALLVAVGQPRFRGGQLARWLYEEGVHDFEAMTDLPAALRQRLAREQTLGRAEIATRQVSADRTVKLLLALSDGARVETVALPYSDRVSVCVSSQTGCAVGCTFCATGTLGAGRNLTVGELTDQLLSAGEALHSRVSHAVFMGMGEPLLNLENVVGAVTLWRDELALSPRRVTISTVGIVPQMDKLAEIDLPVTLAVSLHAADDALRQQLIPTVANRWSVAEVMSAARRYAHKTGRRVTYELALLAGVNDRRQDAELLIKRLKRGEHINLIPYNPIGPAPFAKPTAEAVAAFRKTLEHAGVNVTQRTTRGADIAGACGQLRAQSVA